jgi:hypothetical protein
MRCAKNGQALRDKIENILGPFLQKNCFKLIKCFEGPLDFALIIYSNDKIYLRFIYERLLVMDVGTKYSSLDWSDTDWYGLSMVFNYLTKQSKTPDVRGLRELWSTDTHEGRELWSTDFRLNIWTQELPEMFPIVSDYLQDDGQLKERIQAIEYWRTT